MSAWRGPCTFVEWRGAGFTLPRTEVGLVLVLAVPEWVGGGITDSTTVVTVLPAGDDDIDRSIDAQIFPDILTEHNHAMSCAIRTPSDSPGVPSPCHTTHLLYF